MSPAAYGVGCGQRPRPQSCCKQPTLGPHPQAFHKMLRIRPEKVPETGSPHLHGFQLCIYLIL